MIVAKALKSYATSFGAGYLAFDNLSFAPVSALDEKLAYQNFNTYRLLDQPMTTSANLTLFAAVGNNSFAGDETYGAALSQVEKAYGEQAWRIDWDLSNKSFINPSNANDKHANGMNIDKNNYPRIDELSYDKVTSVVLETDYLITSGSNGKLECQYNSAKSNGKQIGNGWDNLYNIDFEDGTPKLYRNGTSKAFSTDTWHTVSTVINLVTGELKLYLDGELVKTDWFAANDEAGSKNLTLPANKWDIGKVNKGSVKGTVYLDNVLAFVGDAPSVTPSAKKDVADFEEYVYSIGKKPVGTALFNGTVPALLTFAKEENGNIALRLPMGTTKSADDWGLVNSSFAAPAYFGSEVNYDAEKNILIFNGKEYTPTLMNAEKKVYKVKLDAFQYGNNTIDAEFYLAPANHIEAAYGTGNIGIATQFVHGQISYQDSAYAVLQAEYFIEEGSTGLIESQFQHYKYVDAKGEEKTGNWLQMFQLDLATGKMNGGGVVAAKQGEWNTIKIVVDLADGVFNVYINDALARIYDCGNDNITIGLDQYTWSIAKVVRSCDPYQGPYSGAILVDNISVKKAAEITYSEKGSYGFLTDDAFDAFTADLLTSVNAASIRFKDPCGMRFGAIVNQEVLNHLKLIYGKDSVKMGTIIAPADYINAGDVDSIEGLTRADFENINATNSSAKKYLDVAFEGTYFKGDAGLNLEEGKDYMVGSIARINLNNYDRDFVGMSYIEFTLADGTVVGFYSDATVRNVVEIAEEIDTAYWDETIELTEEQMNVVWNYLDGIEQ